MIPVRKRFLWVTLAIAAAAAAGLLWEYLRPRTEVPSLQESLAPDSLLVCVLDLPGRDGERTAGCAYDLLCLTLRPENVPFTIRLREEVDDSLHAHIRICSEGDTVSRHAWQRLGAHSPGTKWWILKERKALAGALERRLHTLQHSAEWKEVIARFDADYLPSQGTLPLSPYDSLFIRYAAESGFDRALLTAVGWKESRFHIESRSGRGATGLMQLMPEAGRAFGAENLLDPEESIAAAARILARAKAQLRGYAASEDDLMKLCLAGYNAGNGRIMDCIRLARELGEDAIRWDILSECVIPLMDGEEVLGEESVRLGTFKGEETRAFVETVCSIRERYLGTIARAASAPGPRGK